MHIIFVESDVYFGKAFIEGLLSILSIENKYNLRRIRTRKDDAEAILSDWEKVGDGVRRSMIAFSSENA